MDGRTDFGSAVFGFLSFMVFRKMSFSVLVDSLGAYAYLEK